MLKVAIRECRKCGKLYKWTNRSIMASPEDYMDYGMCKACRMKDTTERMKKILGSILK